jgi:hypothetical protein
VVTPRERALRRGLLLVVMASAVTAVLAGLARLGIVMGWSAMRAPEHGALLVIGVFGTVIGLERVVALGLRWSYAAPVLGAAGAAGMLGGTPGATWLAVASCVALVAVNVAIVRRQPAAFTWLMLLGSVVLVAGSLVWALGRPVFQVVPAWIAFLVLTIVAERLELSRLAATPRRAQRAVVGWRFSSRSLRWRRSLTRGRRCAASASRFSFSGSGNCDSTSRRARCAGQACRGSPLRESWSDQPGCR